MLLQEIRDNPGARKKFKRVGRGEGSGKGKTCGRGVKGQKARSGVSIKGFEGGQNPLYTRLPKRGFTNIFRVPVATVNLGQLQKSIDHKKLNPKKEITIKELKEIGLVRSKAKFVKLLAKGELKSAINITVDKASETALKAIEKLQGTVIQTASKISS
jgi:large subunit ribosomal protein L15